MLVTATAPGPSSTARHTFRIRPRATHRPAWPERAPSRDRSRLTRRAWWALHTVVTTPTSSSSLVARQIDSPYSPLTVIGSPEGLRAILWHADDPTRVGLPEIPPRGSAVTVEEAVRQLREYFHGDRTSFDLPLDLRGTAFQIDVWRALAEIPYGETRTYAEQAARLGRPAAARAVGAANGRNPLSIVLPCHRVIGSDGALRGFAGGLEAKRALLAFENRRVVVSRGGVTR